MRGMATTWHGHTARSASIVEMEVVTRTRPATRRASRDPLHDPAADDEGERWVLQELLFPDQADRRETAAVLNSLDCVTRVCCQCHAAPCVRLAVDSGGGPGLRRRPAQRSHYDEGRLLQVLRRAARAAWMSAFDEDGVYHLFHILNTML